MLTPDERSQLLELARHAIEARLRGQSPPLPLPLSPGLRRMSGAFVTLRRRDGHDLRGCIGYVEPCYALHDAVARAACSAATEDHRFEPVSLGELSRLTLDISVLTAAAPIRAEDVEVGRHGLIVERGAHRGLLLPQVPVEQGWDVATFLEQTCRKASLPRDAWKETGTTLLAFEAEVFSEEG